MDEVTDIESVGVKPVVDKYYIELWDEYHFKFKGYYEKYYCKIVIPILDTDEYLYLITSTA